MKKLLVVTCAVLALAAIAATQIGVTFRPAPSNAGRNSWTTNTGPMTIIGFMNSNLTATSAKILPVPKSGFGVQIRVGATNALTVTNCTMILEGVVFDSAGLTQVVDNLSWTVTIPVNGTTGYDLYTNMFNNLGRFDFWGIDGVRIRSITNVNTESIFITNLYHKMLGTDPVNQ